MNDTSYTPAQENELRKAVNAFCRVFKSADGKVIYSKLINYRQGFINAALNEKDREKKLASIDMASGVDGVILMIDQALEESARLEKEGDKK